MLRVKICGITNIDDALLAARLGADALGFIFYPKSPRYVSPQAAGEIIHQLPPFVERVGVFVDENLAKIKQIVKQSGITTVQLSGQESPEFCHQFHLPVIKTFRVQGGRVFPQIAEYHVHGYLFDAYDPHLPGGTGKTCDWKIAREAKKFGHLILAGGLKAENLAEALEYVQPYGVDICSGVEQAPGHKDYDKLRQVFTIINRFRYGNSN
ncbi:phosphoribosylanthranilate isomerase [candidate division KSB1 bacterium]|nr:MAG: phosphoribosylanthranilate isomerase [candidate division KSB1 bacterium]